MNRHMKETFKKKLQSYRSSSKCINKKLIYECYIPGKVEEIMDEAIDKAMESMTNLWLLSIMHLDSRERDSVLRTLEALKESFNSISK
jgi:hypothetical protein